MPRKPKKPCAFPGCPKLTEGKYCEEHRKVAAKRYETEERDPATRTRYGSAWRKVRKAYAEQHPLCEECLKAGRYVPVEHVHHKTPLAEGGTNDFSNLMSLCKSCHSKIHAERGDSFGWARGG